VEGHSGADSKGACDKFAGSHQSLTRRPGRLLLIADVTFSLPQRGGRASIKVTRIDAPRRAPEGPFLMKLTFS
jgi:hypothetical protein